MMDPFNYNPNRSNNASLNPSPRPTIQHRDSDGLQVHHPYGTSDPRVDRTDSAGLQTYDLDLLGQQTSPLSQEQKIAADHQSAIFSDSTLTPSNAATPHGGQLTYMPYDGYGPVAPAEDAKLRRHQAPPFGLSLVVFAALVALLTAFVMGAALGGGLGGTLAKCQSSEKNLTVALKSLSETHAGIVATMQKEKEDAVKQAKQDAANNASDSNDENANGYAPTSPSLVQKVRLDCPSGGTKYKQMRATASSINFRMYCGVEFDVPAETSEGGPGADLFSFVAYSIQDCVDACANQYDDAKDKKGENVCRSVVFRRALQFWYGQMGGNCWLKNGTKKGDLGQNVDKTDLAYAALQLSS